MKARGGRRDTPAKSLRIGVHHANGVVWGPVYRTHLRLCFECACVPRSKFATPIAFPKCAHAWSVSASRTPPREVHDGVQQAAVRVVRVRFQVRDPEWGRAVGRRVLEGRSIQANVGVELKGVRSGVERRRGRALKPRDGRRETTGKVLKDRRSPRERGRMGTSV